MRTRAIGAFACAVVAGVALATVNTAGVASAATPDPQPPVISLISPTAGASFSQNAEILLYARVSDPDGKIVKVEFYDGSTLLATDTTAPLYYFAIRPRTATLGAHTLSARAYDDQGLSTTSTAVTVYVTAPPIIKVTGYVQAGVEAGCMLLVPDTGAAAYGGYLLLGGDRSIIVPNAHLLVTGEVMTGVATYCMQGMPFRVDSAQPL